MPKILVANWKMNPGTVREAIQLARASDKKNVVIAPPFVYLNEVRQIIRHASLGAQDLFWAEKGAYTGEISPMMLKKSGVRYVILGHSERRRYAGETDATVNKKVKAALARDLSVILCVGEDWKVRKSGLGAAKAFVRNQLAKDLKGISGTSKILIAYEPVWAIGTGKADHPKDTAEMGWYIKLVAGRNVRVLYGGSVNRRNAARFLKEKEISGVLVGGASLRAKEFKRIIAVAEEA